MRRPMHPWRWSLVLVVLVAGAWWLAGAGDGGAPREWAAVERGDLVLGIEVTGTLQAVETSQLGPPQLADYWEFKISHMAPEGEEVPAGTPVVAFDTSDLQQKLERQLAEAEEARKQIEKTEKNLTMTRRQDDLRLSEAEARLRKARLKVDLPGELSQANELALARLDLELAETEVRYLEARLDASRRSAEAQLAALRSQEERAEQRVAEIREAMELMTRKAPRDATVIYVTNWRDEKKKVGDSCWKGENVVELPNLNAMKAEGRVDEADAGRLAEGQPVSLRLDAHPDVKFNGRIASIWRTVQRESWRNPLKVVRLEIGLDETDRQRMRPGMRFRGKVETERIEDALLLPVESVFPTDGGAVAYRKTLLGHERVPLELGRRDEGRVEVLDGLSEGDRVFLVNPELEQPRT
jgi:multidrug efflux pump subunit AcrA (membrane-fusion protein)